MPPPSSPASANHPAPPPSPPRRQPAVAGLGTDARIDEEASNRWWELENLLNQLERKGAARLPADDVLRLGDLYSSVLADLGQVRRVAYAPELRGYLNHLAARAYGQIYRRPDPSLLSLFTFLLFGFPPLVRARLHFAIGALLVFVCAGLVGFLCLSRDSKLIKLIIPPPMQQAMEKDLKAGRTMNPAMRERKLALSSEIMFNNIGVAFRAFAWGIAFGVGTIYVLLLNGLLVGGLAAIYHEGGRALDFWSLIAPHGGIELLCIFISAGAGLMLGFALINPGPHGRRDWLGHQAQIAVRILVGTVPWFVLAAFIETHITPADIPPTLKLVIGFIGTVVMVAYLALVGADDIRRPLPGGGVGLRGARAA
jgi:uncharacterized membrane protein SpoIIM required for sporulation